MYFYSAYAGFVKCLYQEIKKVGCTDDVSFGYLGYIVIFGTPPGIDFSLEDLDDILNTEAVRRMFQVVVPLCQSNHKSFSLLKKGC